MAKAQKDTETEAPPVAAEKPADALGAPEPSEAPATQPGANPEPPVEADRGIPQGQVQPELLADPTDAARPMTDAEKQRQADFAQIAAMLEGPGGDIGLELDIAGLPIDRLPMCPCAIDAHGRLWAVDLDKGLLRLMGRVTR